MDPKSEPPGDSLIESETSLQAESSTLVGLGPRSLTPSLDLLMILAPVDGAAAAVAPFLQAVETQVEPPFGVMLVYDPNDSATLAVATEFARTRPWLDLVPNTDGPGTANALRCGFRAIGQGPAAVMSIDGSDNPDTLSRMRRLYAEGHTIVSASRDMRGGRRRGSGRLSRAISRIANRLVKKYGHLPLEDATSNFRIYDAALVNKLFIDSNLAADIPVELAAKAIARGIKVLEVPTIWTDKGNHASPLASLTGVRRWLGWCRRTRRRADKIAVTPPSAATTSATDSQSAGSPSPKSGE